MLPVSVSARIICLRLMPQASLDRGFGRCVVLRTHKSGIKKYRNGAVDRVVAPAMRDGRPERGRDRALDADGIAEVGGYINDGVRCSCSCSPAPPSFAGTVLAVTRRNR